MKRELTVVGVFVAAAALVWGIQTGGDSKVLLEKAKYAMETQGDYRGAVRIFEQIIKDFPKDRPAAAAAQLSIGTCLEKLGVQEARAAYEKVIADYPDQTEAVRAARAKLEALSPAAKPKTEAGEGIRLRQVWSGSDANALAAASPDGKYFAYSKNASEDIFIRDAATGETRQVTHEADLKNYSEFASFNPAWSPDGKQVAYCWFNKAGYWEMRTVNIETSKYKIAYSNKALQVDQIYDWSKDNQQVIVRTGGKVEALFLVSLPDGTGRALFEGKEPIQNAKFSPDGRFVAFDHAGETSAWIKEISIIEVLSRRMMAVVKHPADDRLSDWAPDGSGIFFTSNRSGAIDLFYQALKGGRAQGEPRLIKEGLGYSVPVGITTNGIFYYAVNRQARNVISAKIDFMTGKLAAPPRKISLAYEGANDAPALSPDGTLVAYVSSRGPQTTASRGMANTIVVQTLASGDEVAFPVSISIPIFARFCWSSDNRRVFFSGWDKDRKSHVYQLNRSTGAISKMTEDPVLGNAFVSADGKSIFYSSGDGKEGAIIRREVADGSERKLFSDAAIISLGALSPDGKFLAFRWMPLPVREGSSEKRMERVFFLSTDGGDPRVLLENKGEEHVFIQLGWTHDGKNVLVSKRGLNYQDRLWIVPLDGSGPRQTEVVGNMLRSFSLRSEDGSMIYADGSLSADNEIWALENFWPPKPARKRP